MFLGHGNKTSCDRPRVIEALRGKDIIFIACGGAHSAAITATGNLILLEKMSLFVKNHLVVKNLIRIVSFEKSKTRLLLLQKRIKTFIVKEKLHK